MYAIGANIQLTENESIAHGAHLLIGCGTEGDAMATKGRWDAYVKLLSTGFKKGQYDAIWRNIDARKLTALQKSSLYKQTCNTMPIDPECIVPCSNIGCKSGENEDSACYTILAREGRTDARRKKETELSIKTASTRGTREESIRGRCQNTLTARSKSPHPGGRRHAKPRGTMSEFPNQNTD